MKRYDLERVRFKPFGWGEVNHEHRLDDTMKSGARDKTGDALHEMKGKGGKLTHNPKLAAEGKAETIAGKGQGKVGDVKKVWEENSR